MPKENWKWYGNAGHFIGGHECSFHLCTEIGDVLISTVGEWRPRGEMEKAILELGGRRNSFYETMVFHFRSRCDCGCEKPTDLFSEMEVVRYKLAATATAGHMRLCKKWDKRRGKKKWKKRK